MRKCSKCSKLKTKEKFSFVSQGKNKGRYAAWCKKCMLIYCKQYMQILKNREHYQMLEQLPKRKLARKLYAQTLQSKQRAKKWRQSFKGKLYHKLQQLKRRVQEKDLTVKIIQQVYEKNIKQYGTLTCYLCLNPVKFGDDHLEHKIPLFRDGTNQPKNLGIACAKCNLKKGIKTEIEFRKEKHANIYRT